MSPSPADVLSGRPHQARNWSAEARGSIHDDATASKLGFRGGTVAGNIHMDQFAELLLEAFGERWFQDGALSLGFVNATIDGESVQVHAEEPVGNATQIRVWMNRVADELPVAAGTASIGDHSRSELRTRELRPCDPSELRILRGIDAGFPLGKHQVHLGSELQLQRLRDGLISRSLDWFGGPSPWGGPIATPSTLVELLWYQPTQFLIPHIARAVGLFGAIEIAHHDGPVLLDRDYRVSAEVVCVGQSPKTEVMWFDSTAQDESGRAVASMRMMLRFMKGSSELYA